MRRIIAASMGAAALAAIAAMAVPGPAFAASGTLVIGGHMIQDPSGCQNGRNWPLMVDNNTDSPVTVYSEPDCKGEQVSVIPPGETSASEMGSSVYVD